jgi:hypothetical protein
MFDTLKSKIESWSLARLTEHAQYLPIAPLGDRDVGFHEIDDLGLCVIKKYKVIAYNNDSTIATLINLKSVNSTEHDFNTITQLYENGFNIVQPIENTIEDNLRYTLYKSPHDQIGIPFTAEYFINKKFDDTYIEQYKVEIAKFIKL